MFPIIAFVLFSVAINAIWPDDEDPKGKATPTPKAETPKVEAKPEPAKA